MIEFYLNHLIKPNYRQQNGQADQTNFWGKFLQFRPRQQISNDSEKIASSGWVCQRAQGRWRLDDALHHWVIEFK